MLRIDDTDAQRSKKEYENAIRDALIWLGLEWSEEARQSARVERYNEVTEKLKADGRIYACYETPEELEFMRKRLLNKGLPPIYDRQALNLTREQIAKYEAEGRRPHYRFKLLDGDIVWHDLVRGECRYSEKISAIRLLSVKTEVSCITCRQSLTMLILVSPTLFAAKTT